MKSDKIMYPKPASTLLLVYPTIDLWCNDLKFELGRDIEVAESNLHLHFRFETSIGQTTMAGEADTA